MAITPPKRKRVPRNRPFNQHGIDWTNAPFELASARNCPHFLKALQKHFPGAIPLSVYMQKTVEALVPYDFEDENTMGMVAICRDEITDPLFEAVVKYWGKTFNCCSLGGFVLMGKTGLAAAKGHTPLFDGLRRFTFYAMPHIAISRYGEVGKVSREGLTDVSHACGALEAIAAELHAGQIMLQMDMQDIEQTILRQKILSELKYGTCPNLVDLTKLSSQIIAKDVGNLLCELDTDVFHYSVMTGVQIHGPLESQWIYPQEFYIVGKTFGEGQIAIDAFERAKVPTNGDS